ncbi:MAG: hypothetical protein EPN53_01750 [Acidobacteria bacterium]|nr:MAG: hypothetical protein EPN53_01750 [Acidobacteriota bacterium]
MTGKRRFLVLMTLLPLLLIVPADDATAAPAGPGVIWAGATPTGTVEVFWLPTGSTWPAGGWRLERVAGGEATLLAAALKPGQDTAALAALGDREVNAIRMFGEQLGRSPLPADQQQAAEIVVGLSAATDLAFGRALGVRYTDAQPGTRPCRYRVTALDAAGRAAGSFTSRELDPTKATPPPPPPSALEAATSRDGVGLIWADAPRDTDPPVVGYTVERAGADGKVGLRTPRPVVIGAKRTAGQPLYVDHYAPGEAEAVYRVQSVDVLGQGSPWIELRYYVKDLAALDPPKDLRAEAGINAATLAWSPATNPHTKGFVISRSTLQAGPYTVLTPQPLPPATGTYADTDLRGGSPYFYRVQAMGPRDDLGPPSAPAMALPRNGAPPPRVTGVRADVGTTRVRLVWDPVPFQVAGYLVERQAPGAPEWVTLNSRVTPEALYDDFVGPSPGGTLRYRIVAVAYDNQASAPSDAVEAALPDTVAPAPPRITAIDGSGGKVALTFVPAPPEADTAQVLVLRASSPSDPGVVSGDPLPGNARSFEDTLVEPGQQVVYRLLAVDPAGNRSEPSRPVAVRVGSPDLPQPPAPAAKLVNEPFPRVVITVPPPPPRLAVVVERQVEGEVGWFFIAQTATATEVADVHPPRQGTFAYRLVYQAANGLQGPPSPPATISR